MRFDMNGLRESSSYARNVNDLDGFYRCGRFIILSEIKSNTIPNIIDFIFNLSPEGSGYFLDSSAKRTKVTVINISEVYGDAHGRKDTRTRNAFIHYGFAPCGIDQINYDTPIKFTDLDWNILVDKPTNVASRSLNDIMDINVSYDNNVTGGIVNRDTQSYNRILIPSPEFYEEKDMLLIGDREENYYDKVQDSHEMRCMNSFDSYYRDLYTLPLGRLVDSHTKIMKLDIHIENLSNKNWLSPKETEDLNGVIQELASSLKYSLEVCGFCGAEIIIGGRDGFNLTSLKTQMNLDKLETSIYTNLLFENVSKYNDVFIDSLDNFTVMFRFSYSKVDVRIIDKVPFNRENDKTDCLSEELSDFLKYNGACFDIKPAVGF